MSSKAPLKPNPFTTYRDPITGRWIVINASDSLSSSELAIVSLAIEQMQPCCA